MSPEASDLLHGAFGARSLATLLHRGRLSRLLIGADLADGA